MKLEIINKHGIVDDASFVVADDALSVYIDTMEAWRRIDFTMSGPGEISWCYEAKEGGEDRVTLKAENDVEIEILARLVFTLQNKKQIWILMPKDSVYMR